MAGVARPRFRATIDRVISDEELFEAWAGGDLEAGSQLVARSTPVVARFFANKLESGAEVKEATIRVFEFCARSLGRFRGYRPFRTLLFATAYSVLRETRRRTNHPAAAAADALGPWPFSMIRFPRETRLLLDALRGLPPGPQTLIEHAYFEGLSRQEIARALELPPSTIASRLRRAHERLEERVEAHASSPDLARSTRAVLSELAQFAHDRLGPDDPDDPEPAAA
jgi:RNA polymerase sigma factor (sigma-70 family)